MSSAEMATDGPVLSLMNKRLRALKKKHNRIIQMEEAVSQGKALNKEQEEVLRSKPGVLALIDEYEKLRQPLSAAVQEELFLQQQNQPSSTPPPPPPPPSAEEESTLKPNPNPNQDKELIVEDLLKLIYFGSLFDVKPQTDFTSTMLTKTHERGCCLTYDYVTDDATDLLVERDLDLISSLGGLVISRPVHSLDSHKNALRSCLEHAKLWLANSDQPIETGTSITYAGLREKLNKILASDYFTTTPEMTAPVEVAAAAEKYAPCQVPVFGSSELSSVPVQIEDAYQHYQQNDEETTNFQGQETYADQSYPVEDQQHPEGGLDMQNPTDAVSVQQDQQKPEAEMDEQSQRDVETKEQQFTQRRGNQSQRGGSGGRRGYSNGRGGRGSRGGGGYQNGRSQYYDQPGNYYQRNYHSRGGRSGRGGVGGYTSNNHGSTAPGGHAPADAGS